MYPVFFVFYAFLCGHHNCFSDLTAVKVPHATSLSTILTEQAGRRATSFFVTN
jgi:hypothetical protein